MSSIKDRNGMDLTEAEDTKKRWQEYTEELYKKDLHVPDNHDGVIPHLEPGNRTTKHVHPAATTGGAVRSEESRTQAVAESSEISTHETAAKAGRGHKPQASHDNKKRMRGRIRSRQAKAVRQNTPKTHNRSFSFQGGLK